MGEFVAPSWEPIFMESTQCELIGGPLHGTCHELQFGFPKPNFLGLVTDQKEGGEKTLAWYAQEDDGLYYFQRMEKRNDTTIDPPS